MEESSWGFKSSLLADSPRHDFGAYNDLVATGTELAWVECDSVGDRCCVVSNAASADGLVGLQALVR